MKRSTAFILSLVLLLCSFGTFAFADEIFMLTNPTVFLSGEEQYNIVWVTDVASAGFVEINYGGTVYVFSDEKDGVIRTDDWIHTVRVPKYILDGARGYTAVSRTAATNDKNGITYDSETRYTSDFIPYGGTGGLKAAVFSDMHLKPASFEQLDRAMLVYANSIGAADIIILNGDITDTMAGENYFTETLLHASHTLSGGRTPVIYARGNHETRGAYSQYLRRYLAFDTGEMYGKVAFGPMSAVVLDCGEDKADHREEYGGMVDFDNYNQKQISYLENLSGYTDGTQYYLTISHSPSSLIRASADGLSALEGLSTDIMVSGHTHGATEHSGASFPIVTDGGKTDAGYGAAALVFENSSVHFNVFDHNAENLFSFTAQVAIKADTLPPAAETVTGDGALTPLTDTPTGGMSGADVVGASVSASVTAEPTVFDAGDFYNIVYMTDAGTQMTKAAAVVKKDGKTYTFTDSESGGAATNLLHSIAVPKDVLEGATYVIKTTYIGSHGAYGYNIAYDGVYTDVGYTTTSREYSFADFENKEELCIATFSDMASQGISGRDVANSMTAKPDVIVISGNMADGLYSREDFVNSTLKFASAVSGGEKPVIFARGEGECYGDFAPYLSEFLRITKNGVRDGMYFTTSYGGVNFIVCDSAYSKLSPTYMQKQTAWLSELKVTGDNQSFVIAKDGEYIKTVMGANYAALGCTDVLSGGGYGTISYCKTDGYAKTNNTFAGSQKPQFNEVSPVIDQTRLTSDVPPAINYATDEQKAEGMDEATKQEIVPEKVETLEWYEQKLKFLTERGITIDITKEPVFEAVNCADFLVTYCNLSGVNYKKTEGESIKQKAINFAYDSGAIVTKPPLLREYTPDEIKTILNIK